MMTRTYRNAEDPGTDPPNGMEVIPYRRSVPYGSTPDVRLPDRPEPPAGSTGFLGFGGNRQEQAHHRRMLELYYLGGQVAYAEAVATAAEVLGIQTIRQEVAKAEQIVYATAPDSVTGQVVADVTGDMAARCRVRHTRLMEAYDAETLNILHHR